MKTATDTAELGRTVEKTTVTRVLPAETFSERKTPEFWEYLERLTSKDWERFPPHLHHKLYVYRRLGDVGSGIALERFEDGVFPWPGREPIPLNNREEFEFAMAQKYGGGTYRLLLKKGSERITEGRILIDGAPKNTKPGILEQESPSSSSVGATVTTSADPSSDVAKTAMNIVATHEAEAINVGLGMMRTAAEVQRQMASQTSQTAGMDPVTQQFLQVAMARLLQPPPDPLEMFTKFMAVMSSMGGNGAINPTVTRIIDSAIDRFMNPPPAAPGASTGAALVSALPQIASYATEALREWRAGSEVQLETARVMAASGRPPALPPAPGNGTVQPPPSNGGMKITQATQLQPPVQGVQPSMPGVPSLEFIEAKIVAILNKPINGDEAADEVLSFLDLMEPKMIEQLASLSESQLIAIFQTRPVLRQYRDIPRLQEFVRAFLKYSNNQEPAPPDVDSSTKPN